MRTKKSVLWIAGLFTVLAVLLGALIYVIAKDAVARADAQRNQALIDKELISSGLTVEKLELERELRTLSDSDADRLATVTLLFKAPVPAVYDLHLSRLGGYDMKVTVCIAPNNMPGDVGNMSVENYLKMLDGGHSSAAIYNGTSELSEYLSALSVKCNMLGIPMPNTVYFCGYDAQSEPLYGVEYDENGKPLFTSELDSVLEQYNIDYVIQETYQSKTVCYENFYESFRYAETLGFNATKVVDDVQYGLASVCLYEAIENGGAVIFSIGFDLQNMMGDYYGEYDPQFSGDDGSTTDDFMRMLGVLEDYEDELIVTDMAGVDEYRTSYNAELPDIGAVEARRAEILARLAQIEVEIQEIKDKYQ